MHAWRVKLLAIRSSIGNEGSPGTVLDMQEAGHASRNRQPAPVECEHKDRGPRLESDCT